MKNIAEPNVTTLATGRNFVTKQMQAKAGALLPEHHANMESVLFIHEGECILHISNQDIKLKAGEAHSIPANIKHQIQVIADLKGIHFMPINIKFKFF